jgi:hypothetical protein
VNKKRTEVNESVEGTGKIDVPFKKGPGPGVQFVMYEQRAVK